MKYILLLSALLQGCSSVGHLTADDAVTYKGSDWIMLQDYAYLNQSIKADQNTIVIKPHPLRELETGEYILHFSKYYEEIKVVNIEGNVVTIERENLFRYPRGSAISK